MTRRRIVSIWLPDHPVERFLRIARAGGGAPPDDLPLALTIEGQHGPVIHGVTAAARRAGVRAGARVVDMRALCPALQVAPGDPAGDAAGLERLAIWARRWCPWTLAEPGGLALDATGASHLWGGEAAMLEEIAARLAAAGHAPRLAMAPTRGAAWALARYGAPRAISHDPADLAPLPVIALRLSSETALLLRRLGLKTVGDLMALPRLALTRRFARAAADDNPLLRLDQAMGRLDEPLSPPQETAPPEAILRLPDPVMDAGPHLAMLAADLCAMLASAGLGARRIRLSVYRTDGEARDIMAAVAAPTRDPGHLALLLRDRLERIDPGFGFDQITLAAPVTEALAPAQALIGGGAAEAALDLARLVDRLEARFGPGRLRRLLPHDSHIPERAERGAAPLSPGAPVAPDPTRPPRILQPPEEIEVLYAVPEGPPARFRWRGRLHRVTRWQGPERIAPEWWRERAGTRLRDYYRIEDEGGVRLWLYREGLSGDGRGDAPRWFMQGIFG